MEYHDTAEMDINMEEQQEAKKFYEGEMQIKSRKLPAPATKQVTFPEPDKIDTKIERTAQEVHDAYVRKIREMQEARKLEQESRRIAE